MGCGCGGQKMRMPTTTTPQRTGHAPNYSNMYPRQPKQAPTHVIQSTALAQRRAQQRRSV